LPVFTGEAVLFVHYSQPLSAKRASGVLPDDIFLLQEWIHGLPRRPRIKPCYAPKHHPTPFAHP